MEEIHIIYEQNSDQEILIKYIAKDYNEAVNICKYLKNNDVYGSFYFVETHQIMTLFEIKKDEKELRDEIEIELKK